MILFCAGATIGFVLGWILGLFVAGWDSRELVAVNVAEGLEDTGYFVNKGISWAGEPIRREPGRPDEPFQGTRVPDHMPEELK